MKYQEASKGEVLHTTGLHINAAHEKMKPGFDFLNGHYDEPLDACYCIPAGGMRRVEWDSTITNTRIWFPAQHITLRG
jgi:hypothetical protein